MTPSCPKCGSSSVRQITPDFFECTNEILEGVVAGPVPMYRPCGNRFQVAPSSQVESCICGRHSIGNCFDCGRALCGLHGSDSGLFLCADCTKARGQRAGEEFRKREAAVAKEWSEWAERVCAELAAEADPVARLVRYVELATSEELEKAGWRDWIHLLEPSKPAALPPYDRLLTGRPPWQHKPPWDHDIVQRWFLGAVQEPPDDWRIVTFEGWRMKRVSRRRQAGTSRAETWTALKRVMRMRSSCSRTAAAAVSNGRARANHVSSSV